MIAIGLVWLDLAILIGAMLLFVWRNTGASTFLAATIRSSDRMGRMAGVTMKRLPGWGVETIGVKNLLQVPSVNQLVQRYVSGRLLGTVEACLEIACLASVYQNEGRNIRFALVFDLEGRRASQVQLFQSPIELNPKQLQSLSAAFTPESYCLVIAPSQVAGSPPLIIGSTPRPKSVLPPPQLYHPPVVIDVDAPGVVSLSIGEAKAVLKRGEIHEQSRVIPGLTLILETEMLVNEVCKPFAYREKVPLKGEQVPLSISPQAWEQHRSELRRIVARSARRIYAQTLQAIARKMAWSRRGGAVLLLPQSNGKEGLFHGGRWYQSADLQIFRDVVRVLTLEGVYRLARSGRLMSSEPNVTTPAQVGCWANERVRPALRATFSSLDDGCQACADLTAADGATVLRTDFGIEGFSVKLASYEGTLPEPLAGFLETRGNRHRSMAGAIARQPGGIGLVVSQDGEITVFTNPEGVGARHVEIVL